MKLYNYIIVKITDLAAIWLIKSRDTQNILCGKLSFCNRYSCKKVRRELIKL